MKKIFYVCIALLSIHLSNTPFIYEGKSIPLLVIQPTIGAQSGTTVDFLNEKWIVQEKKDADAASQNLAENKPQSRTIILKPVSGAYKKGLQITSTPAQGTTAQSIEVKEIDLPSQNFSYWMKAILLTTGVAALARYIYVNTYGQ